MPGDTSRDVTARLAELEATVRGLTQELVAANERLRQLEATVEEQAAESAGGGAAAAETADEAKRATPEQPQPSDEPEPDATDDGAAPEEEAGDLDDIIVA